MNLGFQEADKMSNREKRAYFRVSAIFTNKLHAVNIKETAGEVNLFREKRPKWGQKPVHLWRI